MDRFLPRDTTDDDPESSERRPRSVLLVDDEAPSRRAFERHLRRAGHTVRCAATVEEGRTALSETEVDVAFVDVRLPDGSGADLIRWAVSNNRAQSVYCMTGSAGGSAATEVLEAGCKEVLEKPIDPGRLAELVPFQDRADPPADEFSNPDSLDQWRRRYAPDVIGENDRLLDALETVRSVADTDCTVLVTGESGTGKEMIARALHAGSPRADGPFIALNCAAIPETMVEAELFGHVRGAFTGAHATRGGRVVAANGGTLFLDEIGDMPLHAQAKLLRVLQDRTIMPVGADTAVTIDIRVVAATNQDLEAMIADGRRFRADLYYRLSVIPVNLPPLRERGDDIIRLARVLLHEANLRNRRSVTGLDNAAERALLTHQWPGNVRELAHLIERTVLLKKTGAVTASDLRLRGGGPTRAQRAFSAGLDLDLRSAMDHVERQLIDEALERTGGNRTEAAALLGVNRTTLVEKIRKHST